MRKRPSIHLLLAFIAVFTVLVTPTIGLAAEPQPLVFTQDYESGTYSNGWVDLESAYGKTAFTTANKRSGAKAHEVSFNNTGSGFSAAGTYFNIPVEGYKYEFENWVYIDRAYGWGMTSNWCFLIMADNGCLGGEASIYPGSGAYVRPFAHPSRFIGDSWNRVLPLNQWHLLKTTYDRRTATFSFQVDGVYYAKDYPAGTNAAPKLAMTYSGGGWWSGNALHGYHDDTVLRVWREDSSAPVTTMKVDPAQPNGNDGWYVSKPTVSLTATDNGGVGIDKTEYSLDGTTWKTYTGAFTIEAEGSTTVRYRSTDKNGNVEAIKSGSLKVDRTAPVTEASVAGPDGDDGWYVNKPTVTLSASDSGGSGLAKTEYSIDGATWTTYDGPVTVDAEGVVTVRYRSVDTAGNTETEKSLSLKIDTVAPAIDLDAASVAVDEGQVAANTIKATDSLGSVSVSVSDGDLSAGEGSWAWSMATADGPADSRTVTVTANDGHGNTSSATFELVVDNVSPNAAIAPLSMAPLTAGSALTVTGSFADPGADTHTAVWAWGDGTESAGSVDQAATSVSGSHSYAKPGLYTVRLTVTDKDGGAGTAVAAGYVVVYDTSAGFITGGGWIDAGGKATFGLNAKYQKGASTPSGQTEFQAKGVNFHSISYDWLVVSGGVARYAGSGTVNGAGDYGFLVVAGDGGKSDVFRIKIWDKAAGTVVFDNRPGAADAANDATTLGGGNLTIHK